MASAAAAPYPIKNLQQLLEQLAEPGRRAAEAY